MLPDGTGASFVDIKNVDGVLVGDKTFLEALNSIKAGCMVYARVIDNDDIRILPLVQAGPNHLQFATVCDMGNNKPCFIKGIVNSDNTSELGYTFLT